MTQYAIQMLPVLGPLSGYGGTQEADGTSGSESVTENQRSGPATPIDTDHIYYCGDVVYDRGITRLLTDEGYVTFSETGAPIYHYYLRDHLGNVRVVMGQTGNIEQVNHYYAFGGLMRESTSPGLQPYKYGGKELDRYAGLDAYDFGARSYFADRMQWSTMDPMCEKYYDVSPYGYCFDNPVKFFDKKGAFPGDFFYTAEAAAIDFGLTYNDNSIRDCKEYASSIIYVRNDKGVLGYTYTIPNVGTFDKSTPSEAYGAEIAAFVHTHSASCFTHWGNEFSGIRGKKNVLLSIEERKTQDAVGDIGLSNRTMLDIYVATPNGSLQKYDPLTGEIITVSKCMPSDSNDTERLNNIGTEETSYIYEINNIIFQENIEKGLYRFMYNY